MKDLSGLPRAADKSEGFAPDKNQWLVEAVFGSLTDAERAKPVPTLMDAAEWRASYAGSCDRQVAYGMLGVERTNPPDVASLWVFLLGHAVHDIVQQATEALFNSTAEVIGLVDIGEWQGQATADMLVRDDEELVLVEIKTTGGFGYKMAATSFKGPEEGPRLSALRQAAIGARAHGASKAIVLLIAMENVSVGMADKMGLSAFRRFATQWTLSSDDIDTLASAELWRAGRQLRAVHGDGVPADEVAPWIVLDDGTEVQISNPNNGSWVVHGMGEDDAIIDAGKTWQCDYCDWKDRCREHGKFR